MKSLLMILLAWGASSAAVAKVSSAERKQLQKKSGQFIYIHKSNVNKKKVQDLFPNSRVITKADALASQRKGLGTPREQTLFFRKTGLLRYTKKMDQLDKDVLVMRLRGRTLAQLKASYPKIPKATLAKAKKRLPSSIRP